MESTSRRSMKRCGSNDLWATGVRPISASHLRVKPFWMQDGSPRRRGTYPILCPRLVDDMKAFNHALVLLALVATTTGCGRSNSNYELLAGKKMRCPEGSHLQFEPWGESGLELVCLLKHGPIVIAEYGHIKIEGQYNMGKEVGEWRWYDASGKVVRTQKYEDAKP